MVALAHVLEPQMYLMTSLLFLGGESFRDCEGEQAAIALLQGTSGCAYTYRGLVAATCELEDHVTTDVARRMSTAELWDAVPLHSRTQ
eukprot:2912502-Pyramimonas_sp.AAC.1